MRIIKHGRGRRYLLPDEGETTEEILRAVARASLEVAEAEDTERIRKLLRALELDPKGVATEWDDKRMLRLVRKSDASAAVGEPSWSWITSTA